MSKRFRRCASAAVAVLGLAVAIPNPAGAATTSTGPNTTTKPYVLPVASGVKITSLLTVDDAGSASNGYEMVGIPDGLGARAGQGGTIDVTMNHELTATSGIVRRHGQKGAFISELTIGRNDKVSAGSDLIGPGVQYWNYLTSSYSTTPNAAGVQADGDVFPAYSAAFGRLCSASLTDPSQLYNAATSNGYAGQLRFANEEIGNEGRTFAVDESGQAWQLPRLGLFSWENTLVAHNSSDTTLVMGQEDGPATASELWVYVGTKQSTGTAVDKAGLTNGDDHVVDLVDESVSTDAQFRTTYGKNTPATFDLAEVDWDQSGADQNTDSLAAGLALNRIEDGAWDPSNPNDFYFVTTAGGNGPGGGLWKQHWNDIENPELGGTLTLLLDGSEGLVSPDNVDIDTHGNLLIQEDPGNNPHVARIMAYRIADGALGTVAQFDPALFSASSPTLLTQDEETSGIIDIEDLTGRAGTFLFDAQVHVAPTNNVAEYVERGQLMRMQVEDWSAVYGS